MVDIFISYSRVDRNFAGQLAQHLERVYDSVWYDKSLYGGQEWWREILKRINTCEVFIYLLSPEAVHSKYCRSEFEEARRLNKSIIPIIIRARTTLPEDLASLHIVDMSNGINVDSLLDLQVAIKHHLIHSATTRLNPMMQDTRPTRIPETARPIMPSRRVTGFAALVCLLVGILVGGLFGALIPAAAGDVNTTTRSTTSATLTPPQVPVSADAPAGASDTVLLRYTPTMLVLLNPTRVSVDVSRIIFTQQTNTGAVSFAADDWGSTRALESGGCFQIWTTEFRILPTPDYCNARQGWRQVYAPRWFWRSDDPAATFSVQRDGLILAVCPVSTGAVATPTDCSVALRSSG